MGQSVMNKIKHNIIKKEVEMHYLFPQTSTENILAYYFMQSQLKRLMLQFVVLISLRTRSNMFV